jgi:alkylation response protein AidB-like acyl-CoA dehydrogenase
MDREECVGRAAGLVPVLRERAPQAEALRCVPQETIDDLCRADLLRAPLPERFGGGGLDFDVILRVAAELGRGWRARVLSPPVGFCDPRHLVRVWPSRDGEQGHRHQ